jgi:trimethylamine monooxygenase
LFDAVALWAVKYVLGEIKLPNKAAMVSDWKKWVDRLAAVKNAHEQIDFQTDFVMDLVKEANYPANLDVAQIFYDWHHDKDINILTYRDVSFTSKFTKTKSPIHHTTFMTALDDSMQTFMHQTK